MKKYNKLEIVGCAILVVGTLIYILASFLKMEPMTEIKSYSDIAFWIGILLFCFGYLKRQSTSRVQAEN